MAAVSLLEEIPDPTERDVRLGLEGNLCRCTGYHNIVKAVLAAAEQMRRTAPMIPAAFDYVRADSADAAIALLAEHGDDAKLLAGGMSLLPLMKLRLATPTVLVDVGRLARPVLRPRRRRPRRDRRAHPAPRPRDERPPRERECGVLRARRRRRSATTRSATAARIGGSVAHGDPASDLPAALLALDATFVGPGPGGERDDRGRRLLPGFPRDRARARRAAHRDPRPEGRADGLRRSRSSTGGPRTGPSSASSRRGATARTARRAREHGLHARCGPPRVEAGAGRGASATDAAAARGRGHRAAGRPQRHGRVPRAPRPRARAPRARGDLTAPGRGRARGRPRVCASAGTRPSRCSRSGGTPLVAHALDAALASGLAPVVVVVSGRARRRGSAPRACGSSRERRAGAAGSRRASARRWTRSSRRRRGRRRRRGPGRPAPGRRRGVPARRGRVRRRRRARGRHLRRRPREPGALGREHWPEALALTGDEGARACCRTARRGRGTVRRNRRADRRRHARRPRGARARAPSNPPEN